MLPQEDQDCFGNMKLLVECISQLTINFVSFPCYVREMSRETSGTSDILLEECKVYQRTRTGKNSHGRCNVIMGVASGMTGSQL